MTESDLSRGIREALTAKGCWVMRLNSGAMPIGTGKARRFIRMGEPGTPDLLVMFPAGFPTPEHAMDWGFLEVKLAKGKLSVAQVAWHEKAAQLGINCRVVRGISEALEAVKSWRFGS